MKKSFLASALSLTIFLAFGAVLVFAQSPQGGGTVNDSGGGSFNEQGGGTVQTPTGLENPFRGGPNSLFALIKTIINKILMPIGGVIAVLAFIYSGFLYVIARGKPADIEKAHRSLLYTAIGTAILLGAWVFATVICMTIGQLGGPACPA
ncbi:MAG: pilin [Candidatus Zambryskibacteria bacterium]|nr:pilin [Candidatus Zambryskibacteria bacterium]